tara:strand:- start:611 stop:1132 length:522 start_codon:yes stop_codon:yes gene_type:complete
MPDYSLAKIYMLWSPQGSSDEIYYGSTCSELRKRKTEHKCKNNTCVSKQLFEKYEDVRIDLVESCPCTNKEELNKREGEFIRNNVCLNKKIPNRTQKEWYVDNENRVKEYQKEYQQIYRQNNKEKREEYKLINEQKIAEQTKKYYEANQEKIKEYNKKYYQTKKIENKEIDLK